MAVIKFLVYMTCFCLYQVFCDNYGESGNEITLTPSIRGKPEEILWKHKDNKVLEYDGSEVAKYGLFKDRVDVNFETGQLTIKKLNSQDSGKYKSEIWINGKVQTSSHTLTILDALPEPRVTCEVDETSNLKKLSCSVESQTQPSYEWSGPDLKELGPTLLVDEQEENGDSVYTCTVMNKAASRTTDFTLQDCHTGSYAVRASPAVFVPAIIVAVLLIILLAMLALYFYRRSKQKLHTQEAGKSKLDPENGECDSLLRNVSTKTMPGSSDATLPCHTRLTAPKESIADKKWDRHSESENLGETHEGQKLLKASPQTAIGNTNQGELDKNEKNSKYAFEAEENANSKPDETDRETERQKSSQTQEERGKESPILKNESENEENSSEEQKTEDADKNWEAQTPENKKGEEEENTVIDNQNTGSSDATLPCCTRLTAPKESIANKKGDHDSESESSLQTQEEMGKESPILKNERIQENENQENSSEEQIETLGEQKPEDADKNGEDQTPGDEKGEEEENTVIDNPNSGESDNLLRNVSTETMPGSSDATLPCRTRLTIANKKGDHDSESESSLQTREEREKESPILKSESENQENSFEEQIETLGEQKPEDADKNGEDQTPGDEKGEEEENTVIDNQNSGESNNLLRNVLTEAMQGSSDATLPCCTRLTAPKEFEKLDQDSESENAGETHAGQKLLKASSQSAIREDNKKDTEIANKGELDKNESNSENADESEENSNSEPDETDKEIERKKTQEEMEKEKSQTLKNDSENEEKSPEEQVETLGDQKTEGADKKDQTLEEKKEENKETDSLNTGSPDATLPCHTDEAEENPNSKQQSDVTDRKIESQNSSQTQDEIEKEKSQIQNNEEMSPKEQTETLSEQNTEVANKNEEEQTSGDKREMEEENEEIDSPNTGSPDATLPCHTDEAEENPNSKSDETDRKIESQNFSQTQDEMEKEKSQIQKNEEKSPKEQIETLREQYAENANKNEEDQTSGDKREMEEENEEIDSPNTGSSDGALNTSKESTADQKCDQDSGSKNAGDAYDGQKLLKASPQSAITETIKEDTGNTNEGEVGQNEKNSKNADESEGNANSEPDETQSQKTEDADKNKKDQTPEEKKGMEEENEGTDSPNTAEPFNPPSDSEAGSDPVDSPANPEKEPTNTDIKTEEENTFLGVEQKNKENVLTNEDLKRGQERMQEENKLESSEPKISISKQTHPDNTIPNNSVSQQQDHNNGLSIQEGENSCEAVTASSNITDQKQDDNGEQRDKNESEQETKENNDVPGNNETKDNKHLIYNNDKTNTSVSEDQKTETDSY